MHPTKGGGLGKSPVSFCEGEDAPGRRCLKKSLGDGVAVERSGQAAGRNLHNGGRQQHITTNSRLPSALHSWHLALCCSSMLGSPLVPLVSSLPSHLEMWKAPACACVGKEGGVQHASGQRSGQLRHRVNKHGCALLQLAEGAGSMCSLICCFGRMSRLKQQR